MEPVPAPCAERLQELTGELEHRLLILADQLRARIAAAAAGTGLTPQQAVVVRYLVRPRAMSELAHLLGCDRSNVTGLISRLEARGLVQRVPDPADRRIKRLVLTDDGIIARAGLQSRLESASPATAGLAGEERRMLLSLVRKLTPELESDIADCGSGGGSGGG